MKKALSIIFVVLLLVTITACTVRRQPNYNVDRGNTVIQTAVPTATPQPPATPVPTAVPMLPFDCTITDNELDSEIFTMTVPNMLGFEKAGENYRFALPRKMETTHSFYVVSKDHSMIANGIDREALEAFLEGNYGSNRTLKVVEYEEMHGEDGSYGVRMLCEIEYRGNVSYCTYYSGVKGDNAIEFISADVLPKKLQSFAQEMYDAYGTIQFK